MQTAPLHNERELWLRVARDDQDAFSTLYQSYIGILYPFIMKKTHSDSWAEEIIQDVFTWIWSNRERFNTIDNVRAYLFRMTANRTLDYMRRHIHEVKVRYALAKKLAADNNNFTSQDHDFRATQALVNEAVNKLSPQRKKVYQLKNEGFTYEEIARQLKVSPNTVKNHMAEALHSIRSYIDLHNAVALLLIGCLYT